MSEWTIKVFLGSNETGLRLRKAIGKVADEKYFGNMSRLLVWDFCEKYGYDPRTGKPSGVSTGAPPKKVCSRPEKPTS